MNIVYAVIIDKKIVRAETSEERRFNSPVLSAAKVVSLTTAMVSIFPLETVMFSQFGGTELFQKVMTVSTAATICVILLVLAIGMLIHAKKQIQNLPDL